jgi:hypothetical protein
MRCAFPYDEEENRGINNGCQEEDFRISLLFWLELDHTPPVFGAFHPQGPAVSVPGLAA